MSRKKHTLIGIRGFLVYWMKHVYKKKTHLTHTLTSSIQWNTGRVCVWESVLITFPAFRNSHRINFFSSWVKEFLCQLSMEAYLTVSSGNCFNPFLYEKKEKTLILCENGNELDIFFVEKSTFEICFTVIFFMLVGKWNADVLIIGSISTELFKSYAIKKHFHKPVNTVWILTNEAQHHYMMFN